jgi:ribosomal protein S13
MLRVFNFVELEDLDHLVAEAWLSIPRSSETDRNLFATCSEYKQELTNKHIYIYMQKNITPYKIKCYKNMQHKIELESTVMRGKETRRSSYSREVIAFTLNKY